MKEWSWRNIYTANSFVISEGRFLKSVTWSKAFNKMDVVFLGGKCCYNLVNLMMIHFLRGFPLRKFSCLEIGEFYFGGVKEGTFLS